MGVIAQMTGFIADQIGLTGDALDCGCALEIKTIHAQPCECTCDSRPANVSCHCNPTEWITLQDQLAYEYILCQQHKLIESGQLSAQQIIEELYKSRALGEQARCYHAMNEGAGASTSQYYTDMVLDLSKELYIRRNGINHVTSINGTMIV